jgi:hypothetical protein
MKSENRNIDIGTKVIQKYAAEHIDRQTNKQTSIQTNKHQRIMKEIFLIVERTIITFKQKKTFST